MNIVVTGANGQLGQAIQKIADHHPENRFRYTDLPETDITDEAQVLQVLSDFHADFLINCAAYTAVDMAESNPEQAFRVNETGPAVLASACRQQKCKLIHISTDYVFSGRGFIPWQPADPVDPQSVYARSKAAGEHAVLDSGAAAWIIRTSWLYAEFGQNFVKTMIRLGQDRDSLQVVADQIGSPTYAEDLAAACLKLMASEDSRPEIRSQQIYHFANQGVASWYDFSMAVMEMTGSACQITPVPTEAYPLPAPRPRYSVLDSSLMARHLNLDIPYWRHSLKKCINILQKTQS